MSVVYAAIHQTQHLGRGRNVHSVQHVGAPIPARPWVESDAARGSAVILSAGEILITGSSSVYANALGRAFPATRAAFGL